MVSVFLYGSEKESGVINVLLPAIHAAHAAVIHVTARTVSLLPPDADHYAFLILDSTNIQNFHMDKGIVLFKNDLTGCTDITLPSDFIAIVDPQNEKAAEIIKKYRLQTITCGLSQRDTLTYSSIDAENAVISLQREIKTLQGNPILPREIPILLNSAYDNYQLLAAMAVLLLSEVTLPETGFKV